MQEKEIPNDGTLQIVGVDGQVAEIVDVSGDEGPPPEIPGMSVVSGNDAKALEKYAEMYNAMNRRQRRAFDARARAMGRQAAKDKAAR